MDQRIFLQMRRVMEYSFAISNSKTTLKENGTNPFRKPPAMTLSSALWKSSWNKANNAIFTLEMASFIDSSQTMWK